MKLPDPPLLLVTDRKQAALPLPDTVAATFVGGWRWASVREKDLPASEQIALARRLLPMARHHGACLMLHGDYTLARAAGVDGVHLAAGDNPGAARAALGAQALIGISVHSVREAATLSASSLDYAIAGPAYQSASKPGYGPALGRAGLAAIVRATAVPIIAIGGIAAANVPDIMSSGVVGIAVMGAVMRTVDPASEAAAVRSALAAYRGRD